MTAFTIPYPAGRRAKAAFCRRYGLNAYYAGKHWAERRRDAEALHLLTWAAMAQAGLEARPAEEPVGIRFFWDDGLDADNHAVLGKAIVDAMKGRLLRDDSRRWVRGVSHAFWDGGAIRVEVAPWEEGRWHEHGI